jgi:hypothetical protein
MFSWRFIEHQGGEDRGGTTLAVGEAHLDAAGEFESQPFSRREIAHGEFTYIDGSRNQQTHGDAKTRKVALLR